MYPKGAGCSGEPTLVRPGEDDILSSNSSSDKILSDNSQIVDSTEISCSGRSYNVPMKEEELENLTHKTFSSETMKKIRWVTKMYREWRIYRNGLGTQNINCDLDNKDTITEESLIFAISRFITEVKKIDGTDFPGRTLYDIVICIQFHLETLGFRWKLLSELVFSDVKFSLDNMMKLCTSQGIGVSVKKAQVMSPLDEDLLWSLGFLGTSNPTMLLNTVVFLIGKGCALRAGKEHHALRSPPFSSQFNFSRDSDGEIFLRYKEDIGLKTNKGGIKHRKIDPKEVDIYAIENVNRCPLRIIMFYLSMLPQDRKSQAFYLQPRKKIVNKCWFLDRPAGQNKLRDVVKEMCKDAGLPGFYTNHSLRSTSATRMYRANIDEQLIQEITGHRSLAVRSYKRTCDKQRKFASNCIFQD